jgi:glycosyltransferase involved in cell wall biosynthesis
MYVRDNDAPLLIDVSRLVWRRWSGTRATGIDRICLAWLEFYAPRAQAVIIHRQGKAILPEGTSRKLFELLLRPERSKRDVLRFRLDMIRLGLGHGTHLKDRLHGRGRIWLNAGHTGLDVPGLAEWCRRRDLRPVYLVHDLIPITHPHFCREGEKDRHKHRICTMLATAAGVVANSEDTLRTYESFARETGAKLSPRTVAWPGTHQLGLAHTEVSHEPRFVVLGTIEGRKNHKLLLSVWQDLVAQAKRGNGTAMTPRLVILGRRGWQADDVFALLDQHDFKGNVIEVGPQSDAQLARELSGARALLFPSFVEGFGMPMVEALAAGVPVIASDLPVFHEIGQGVPDLLPVSDAAAWRDAVLDYARPESEARARQIARMTQFHAPSWAEHFARIDRLIADLTR